MMGTTRRSFLKLLGVSAAAPVALAHTVEATAATEVTQAVDLATPGGEVNGVFADEDSYVIMQIATVDGVDVYGQQYRQDDPILVFADGHVVSVNA